MKPGYAVSTIIALALLALVPASFVYSSIYGSLVQRLIPIRVAPDLSGGEIELSFLDFIGDDRGAGELTAPLSPVFSEGGGMDILRYTVHRPLVKSRAESYWQLDVTLAALPNQAGYASGFSQCAIRIYIDVEGQGPGSTEGADARGELVSFDPSHPWDLAVSLDGAHPKARLRSSDGSLDQSIDYIVSEKKKTIYIRIPLSWPITACLRDGRSSWHYLMVGAWDPYAPGNLMSVKAEAGIGNAGGSRSRYEPKLFDLLCPEGSPQSTILSSWDEGTGSYAVILPVEISKAAIEKKALAGSRLKELKAASDRESKEQALGAKAHNEGQLARGNGEERAIALFNLGKRAEAEAAFDMLLRSSPDRCAYIAYKGALVAMKGGERKNPADSVKVVLDAYAYLDRAVELGEAALKGDDLPGQALSDCITARMSRAEVSMGVPESVFKKAALGASDFSRCAELFALAGMEKEKIADLRVKAALCYLKAECQAEAEREFLMAAAQASLSAFAAYELAKAGY